MSLNNLNIAIVCDWLTSPGGAEKVIMALHEIFPQAPLYTSMYNPDTVKGFDNATIHTSYLQGIPLAKKHHQWFLPFFPHIFEKFDFSNYDIVISSSHSCAKGIITKPQTLHICYCHSPMRYAWDGSHKYVKDYSMNNIIKRLGTSYIHQLRMWDRLSADRVDYFIANSHLVQQRIQKYYRRPSTVIHPFVDTEKFSLSDKKRENFFLAAGRLTPYKRFDLIIEACNKLKVNLKIVGQGVAMKELKRIAGETIEFLGYVDDKTLENLFQEAQALIFPQIEDFGITPLEAMASGCPVIAYRNGGSIETVIEEKNGLFFEEQTVNSLMNAIEKFKEMTFDSHEIRRQSLEFDKANFKKKILGFVEEKWINWKKTMTI
ncbi:glycosyltransferase [Candidatus Peregrinibacteria bacterium]|nr:glycosyltransferase [Candidatus Peregrinibacteria bacterium]